MSAPGARPPAGGAEYLNSIFGLSGRVAVVIGGTSGLGAASAIALGRCGATVFVVGRDAHRAAETVSAIEAGGGTAHADTVDVLSEGSVEALAGRIYEREPQVDILVNSAGVFSMGPTADLALDEWRRIIDTNLTGTFLTCRAFGRRMVEAGSGRIINFASTDGVIGVAEEAAYCASKGGVIQLTRALAAEWIKHGVHVNALAPTDFATPMTEALIDDPEYRDWALEAIPLGRIGRPDELLGALLLLASQASEVMVGATVMVDGGRTIV